MTYELFIGDRAFSSWSLRGWLMFVKFGLPVKVTKVGLYSGTMSQDLADLAPARLVPVMRDADGVVLGDSLAMAETLAERHPEAGLWPAEPAARALARWMVAEMHSGFAALRSDCPMQLLHQLDGFAPSPAVMADLARIEELWAFARTRHGEDGPWLFGSYSLADVFYAPIAARMAGYDLPISVQAQEYVHLTLSDTLFRQWRAMGLTVKYDPVPYETGLPKRPWSGPKPLPAQPVEHGPPENDACPYSGKPSVKFMKLGSRVFGFCNQFCRDKSVADPEAWPALMALVDSP